MPLIGNNSLFRSSFTIIYLLKIGVTERILLWYSLNLIYSFDQILYVDCQYVPKKIQVSERLKLEGMQTKKLLNNYYGEFLTQL